SVDSPTSLATPEFWIRWSLPDGAAATHCAAFTAPRMYSSLRHGTSRSALRRWRRWPAAYRSSAPQSAESSTASWTARRDSWCRRKTRSVSPSVSPCSTGNQSSRTRWGAKDNVVLVNSSHGGASPAKLRSCTSQCCRGEAPKRPTYCRPARQGEGHGREFARQVDCRDGWRKRIGGRAL